MFTIINIIDSCRREVVKQREVARKLQYQQRAIGFCQSVLNGRNKQMRDVIDAQDFSPLNIAEMQLTRNTFEDSFKHVCEELFKIRPVNISYIIAIFVYALKLDEYHLLHSRTWYETELLTRSLVDVLIAYGFEFYIPDIAGMLK